jgi:sugar-specific transcriptional regulator TrmB
VPTAPAPADSVERQAGKPGPEEISIERKKQVAEESARLLKLASELKTEVDKTNEDMLSLTVIRKADAIEKMAHVVREDSKPSAGAN